MQNPTTWRVLILMMCWETPIFSFHWARSKFHSSITAKPNTAKAVDDLHRFCSDVLRLARRRSPTVSLVSLFGETHLLTYWWNTLTNEWQCPQKALSRLPWHDNDMQMKSIRLKAVKVRCRKLCKHFFRLCGAWDFSDVYIVTQKILNLCCAKTRNMINIVKKFVSSNNTTN